jgi:hypothetical protein
VTYFTQHIGKVLKDHDNFLNFIVYVEALLHEAQIKQMQIKKASQLDFRTLYHFAKLCALFNSFLGECTNFADFLRVTTIQRK